MLTAEIFTQHAAHLDYMWVYQCSHQVQQVRTSLKSQSGILELSEMTHSEFGNLSQRPSMCYSTFFMGLQAYIMHL